MLRYGLFYAHQRHEGVGSLTPIRRKTSRPAPLFLLLQLYNLDAVMVMSVSGQTVRKRASIAADLAFFPNGADSRVTLSLLALYKTRSLAS